MQNFKKYLPSKQFVASIITIVVIILLFFLVKGLFKLVKKINLRDNEPTKITIGELIQKDSNNNGIADWEENLWGLNPAKNGPENKEFILSKKKVLKETSLNNEEDTSSLSRNKNALLSRELLATILSLQQSGGLDDEAIENISKSIGEQASATPIADVYSLSDLKIEQDSIISNQSYYKKFENLALEYQDKDIGEELTLISIGLGNNEVQALNSAKLIGDTYIEFSQKYVKIPVPASLSTLHLSLANNYYKTGLAVQDLSLSLSDPILGMKAIINYKKYSEALIADSEKFAEVLQ